MLEQTKSQISDLKLFGILKTLDLRLQESASHGWGNTELLSALITDERNYREINKLNKRIKYASFRTQAGHQRTNAVKFYQSSSKKCDVDRSYGNWKNIFSNSYRPSILQAWVYNTVYECQCIYRKVINGAH